MRSGDGPLGERFLPNRREVLACWELTANAEAQAWPTPAFPVNVLHFRAESFISNERPAFETKNPRAARSSGSRAQRGDPPGDHVGSPGKITDRRPKGRRLQGLRSTATPQGRGADGRERTRPCGAGRRWTARRQAAIRRCLAPKPGGGGGLGAPRTWADPTPERWISGLRNRPRSHARPRRGHTASASPTHSDAVRDRALPQWQQPRPLPPTQQAALAGLPSGPMAFCVCVHQYAVASQFPACFSSPGSGVERTYMPLWRRCAQCTSGDTRRDSGTGCSHGSPLRPSRRPRAGSRASRPSWRSAPCTRSGSWASRR